MAARVSWRRAARLSAAHVLVLAMSSSGEPNPILNLLPRLGTCHSSHLGAAATGRCPLPLQATLGYQSATPNGLDMLLQSAAPGHPILGCHHSRSRVRRHAMPCLSLVPAQTGWPCEPCSKCNKLNTTTLLPLHKLSQPLLSCFIFLN